ncbi:MAG TPA: hypothetical protein PLE33_02550 [Candidatus Cloacimonas sp.]|nr:hypothetical protein [Candidatus Cloacimonas sp.]HPS60126.1 hypothetical protein [Candidatus Cloacimonas sp.]
MDTPLFSNYISCNTPKLALSFQPSAESPLGRHNDSDGGVSPSENMF